MVEPADLASPALRATVGRLVLAKGVFDLTHYGHVQSLRAARELGDSLVVALASDQSVARRKGPGRPVLNLTERVGIIAGLRVVDYVTVYDEVSPFRLVATIRPDRFCATHFASLTTPEQDELRRLGVELTLLPRPRQRSTSDIIADILQGYTGERT
ncbi:adenylyltransferase/cytidyltransferase family protein [Streptomyces sp. NBC_01498]|uniref:adenylyltransferase/cytidyltransferase family protein n=1 Tax=Streptomyces sp. NBC_01498 TaxID=2975870 RepID=UPI002E7B4CD8|nr:adenylyltransferase/cytidyltransferase family protein [Streptomyces sp. NBC_01498]WTL27653.1 adenylyltransferase/cytidyltransferase family protein [Streptomyces sp. NBC_01498]